MHAVDRLEIDVRKPIGEVRAKSHEDAALRGLQQLVAATARQSRSTTAVTASACTNGPLATPKLMLLMKALIASGSAR
jgi:hypothetical protein